jgi:hypothetical protein
MPSLVDRFQRPFAGVGVWFFQGFNDSTQHPMTASLSSHKMPGFLIVHFPSMIWNTNGAVIYGFLDLVLVGINL